MNAKDNGSASRWWRILGRRRRNGESVAFRRLALQLYHDLSENEGMRSVLIVTPSRSVIAAQVSMHMACSAASELPGPVLLIEACPRDPQASTLLECADRLGFADLRHSPGLTPDTLVLPTSCENVFFLPAGHENLAVSSSVDALLRDMEKRYALVILHGGSVLDDSAALSVVPHVGCVLLTIIERKTRIDDLEAAQRDLSMCHARRIGLLHTTPTRGGISARTLAHNRHNPDSE